MRPIYKTRRGVEYPRGPLSGSLFDALDAAITLEKPRHVWMSEATAESWCDEFGYPSVGEMLDVAKSRGLTIAILGRESPQ